MEGGWRIYEHPVEGYVIEGKEFYGSEILKVKEERGKVNSRDSGVNLSRRKGRSTLNSIVGSHLTSNVNSDQFNTTSKVKMIHHIHSNDGHVTALRLKFPSGYGKLNYSFSGNLNLEIFYDEGRVEVRVFDVDFRDTIVFENVGECFEIGVRTTPKINSKGVLRDKLTITIEGKSESFNVQHDDFITCEVEGVEGGVILERVSFLPRFKINALSVCAELADEGRGAAMNVRDEGMRKIAIDNSQVVSVKMSELILKFPPTSLSSRRLVLEIPLNMRKLIGEGEGRYDVFFSRLSFITILNTLNHNSWTVITDVKYKKAGKEHTEWLKRIWCLRGKVGSVVEGLGEWFFRDVVEKRWDGFMRGVEGSGSFEEVRERHEDYLRKVR